jgi:hypothetical protein
MFKILPGNDTLNKMLINYIKLNFYFFIFSPFDKNKGGHVLPTSVNSQKNILFKNKNKILIRRRRRRAI